MENWLLQVALKKAAYGAAKGLATFLLSAKAVQLEAKFGLSVDPNIFQASVAAVFLGGIEWIHDWAKLRFPNVTWL